MGLLRLLIVGMAAMAGLYIIASAIVALIPYAVGAMVLGTTIVGTHRWLASKDAGQEIDPS